MRILRKIFDFMLLRGPFWTQIYYDEDPYEEEVMGGKIAIVELWEGRDGKWYFHKKGKNGKITEPSQGYAHRRSARAAAKRDIPGLPIVVLN